MIRFAVLGPLRVERDGHLVPLNALMVRRLLAALLSRAGDLVPVDELIFALWGEDAPPSSRKTLQVYVRRLRAALGEDQRIIHEPAGYRIRVADDELDSAQFAGLVATGRRERTADLLQEALGLWRGAAFEDVREHAPLLDEARRLDEERLRVEAEWVELKLELGHHDEVIPHLAKLTEAHPFREDLREHLMLALYRGGRQTEALELFRCTRKLLDDELGISPGPGLARLHESILRAAPELDLASTTSVVPRELPADVGGFVGRTEQLRTLDAMIPDSSPVVISAIAGTAGVGKTALAVHWARRVASRFPDGQLYLNLNGFSSSAHVRPIDALASMLRSVGVPSEKVPMEEADAAALFRTTVAARQMLIVLDNARSVDQVRPLLPGSQGCLVLVTSRNKLSGLVAREGARRLDLDVLSPGEARDLLARIVGEDRVRADPSAVDELAQACAYLPLALRVAAANLNDQPHRTVAAHVNELRSGNRLASLAVQDDDQAAVRSAFDLSYQDIEASVRSTFRLLGLVPGRDFTVDAVAAMAGLSRAEASRHLVRLSNAHLIEQVGQGRYSFHDLLRLYASERASAEDSEGSRKTALQRLFDWYLHYVEAAANLLYPNVIRLPVPHPASDATTASGFRELGAAADWLDLESGNLLAAIRFAAENDPRNMAWLLVSSTRGYFAQRRHLADWLPATAVAVAAASEYGDKRAQAAARLALAHAHQTRYEASSAAKQLRLAAQLASEALWPELRATCVGNLVGVLYDLGSLNEAVAAATESLHLAVEAGYRFGEAQALNNLGLLKLRMGLLDEATEILRTSAGHYLELGGGSAEMLAVSYLAESLRLQGRLGETFALLRRAQEAAQRANVTDALPLQIHAMACLDLGLTDEAMASSGRALKAASRVGHRFYESIALVAMGAVLVAKSEYKTALDVYRRGIGLATSAGARFAAIEAAIGLAAARNCLKDHGRAQEEASAALESARELGLRVAEGQARMVLARIEFDQGNAEKALVFARGALENHRRTGCLLGEADALMLLADLATESGIAIAHHRAAEEIYRVVRSVGLQDLRPS